MSDGDNAGHGHVYRRPDGVRARCGGPPICAECSRDYARKYPADDTVARLTRERDEARAEVRLAAENAALWTGFHQWTAAEPSEEDRIEPRTRLMLAAYVLAEATDELDTNCRDTCLSLQSADYVCDCGMHEVSLRVDAYRKARDEATYNSKEG